MASWKKMAEAFGRALADPGTSREGRRLIKAGKRELTDARLKPSGDGLRVEPSNPRYDKDVADAYTRGQLGGIQDDMENIQKGYDREERDKLFGERTEQRTDEVLETLRDKEWDAAFRHAQGVMELPDDEMNDVLRSLIKDLKSRGFTEQDVLNSLRSLGDK